MDAAERDRLILENTGRVKLIAERIRRRLPSHVDVRDLIQAGTVGLIAAVDNFDPAKHCVLATYASPKISGAILDWLRKEDPRGRKIARHEKQMDRAAAELSAKLCRWPEPEEVADRLGIDLTEYERWRGEIFNGRTIALEGFTDGAEDNTFARLLQEEAEGHVRAALAKLGERDRRIIEMIFIEGRTSIEVGAILHIDQSRVSRLKGDALGRLRRLLLPISRRAAA